MSEAITPAALETLFTGARTHNGWLDIPVSDETLREIYDLMKWGPTSANCSPARIVFVRSPEGKEKLRPVHGDLNNGAKKAQPQRHDDKPGRHRRDGLPCWHHRRERHQRRGGKLHDRHPLDVHFSCPGANQNNFSRNGNGPHQRDDLSRPQRQQIISRPG